MIRSIFAGTILQRAQTAALWLLAALHVLLLASVCLVITSLAARAETPACTGRDLIAEMKANDAALKEALVEAKRRRNEMWESCIYRFVAEQTVRDLLAVR